MTTPLVDPFSTTPRCPCGHDWTRTYRDLELEDVLGCGALGAASEDWGALIALCPDCGEKNPLMEDEA